MASFFSDKTDTGQSGTGSVSPEIFQAVSVMGDVPKTAFVSKNEIKPMSPTAPVAQAVPKISSALPSPQPIAVTRSPFLTEATNNEASPVVPVESKVPIKPPVSVLPVNKVPSPLSSLPPFSPKIQNRPVFGENAYSGIHETPAMTAKQESPMKYIVFGVLFVLVIGGGGAAWYFLRYVPAHSVISEALPADEPAVEAPVVSDLPYALDKPNYLSFDVETITASELQEMLRVAGERMKVAQMTRPVEFLVTDKNNNPIALSRFVYLMKLTLPEPLMATLGNDFSIFVYNDKETTSLGLELAFTDVGVGGSVVKQKEATLPVAFRPFLYTSVTVPQKAIFRSGVYNTETVRFVNLDTLGNISFDYVIRGNRWFIGTSKDTLRAILDARQ